MRYGSLWVAPPLHLWPLLPALTERFFAEVIGILLTVSSFCSHTEFRSHTEFCSRPVMNSAHNYLFTSSCCHTIPPYVPDMNFAYHPVLCEKTRHKSYTPCVVPKDQASSLLSQIVHTLCCAKRPGELTAQAVLLTIDYLLSQIHLLSSICSSTIFHQS